jgi:hypothetical protein
MAMTQTMPKPATPTTGRTPPALPQIDDRYGCRICGMEIQVIAEYRGHDARKVHFECCGKKLAHL